MNKLIFGKADIKNIVSCEVNNNEIILFCEDKDSNIYTIKKPHRYWILAPIKLDNDFTKLDGKLYYSWIKLYETKEKFLEDKKKYYKKDIYLINDEKEAAMVLFGFTYFQDLKVEDVSVLSWDIESSGLTQNNDSYVYIISNTFRNKVGTQRKMFCCDEYSSQKSLIEAWCTWVQEVNPSIVVGHNEFGYDFGYMDFVARMNDTELFLGRDGSAIKFNAYSSKFRKDGSQSYDYTRCFIYGREIVDTMFLAYKYDFSRQYLSYGLKQIIKQEGLEIENRQFYDASLIGKNWNNLEEREKIKNYAKHDADDALALYDLMVPSYFYWNQSIPKSCQSVNYTATGSQINGFLVRSYLQDFHSIPKASVSVKFEGAISFGIAGVYKNVFKVDVASLYPNIILEYEIYDRYKDPNGYFLKMVKYFTDERLKNKKLGKETGDRYYKDLEQSQKIGINSAYGMLAAQVNFNSPSNAAFVTKMGRDILGKAIKWASGQDVEYWTSKDNTDGTEELNE